MFVHMSARCALQGEKKNAPKEVNLAYKVVFDASG